MGAEGGCAGGGEQVNENRRMESEDSNHTFITTILLWMYRLSVGWEESLHQLSLFNDATMTEQNPEH